MAKTLKEFDSLKRSDFDNGAVLNEIRKVYKQRDDLLEVSESLLHAYIRELQRDAEIGFDAEEVLLVQQARAAMGKAGGHSERDEPGDPFNGLMEPDIDTPFDGWP